ncbi:prenyltransferase/squalene oxidase repeat-containing protein [Streptomyces sp. NPDC048290]|uniref:prenyltransferase/squalene oxidase repeat-containing protein n=1 Tax=Streptomyces sp. NPDC048290 TaxID=3155811 RepID=UPI00342A356F
MSPTGISSGFATAAGRLIEDVDADAWGNVSVSVYETARVVSLAPQLAGNGPRLAWLMDQQHTDGSWGDGPAPYRLLPTLSAIEALLATVRRNTPPDSRHNWLVAAAGAGLAHLRAAGRRGPWPDTAAIEVLVPHLTSLINEHLDQAGAADGSGLGVLARGPRIAVPAGFRAELHQESARRYGSFAAVPPGLHHTFEGIPRPPGPLPPADVLPGGLLGSSPAATAALAATQPRPDLRDEAGRALDGVAARYGGLFPEAAPLAVFERLWVAAALTPRALPATAVATAAAWARRAITGDGVRGAPGLLPDADDTAMAVLVTALTSPPGDPVDPCPLAAFWAETHYHCYPGESTGSVTANAHALQALNACAPDSARQPHRDAVRDWLTGRQRPDGSWHDKWHASPYYATLRCADALTGHPGPAARTAVRAAARWVLDTQRADGTWGVWSATAEESAYAVRTLEHAAARDLPGHHQALERARPHLADIHRTPGHRHPPLWHDKTLYAPHAVIQAELLTALDILHTRRTHGPQPATAPPGGPR